MIDASASNLVCVNRVPALSNQRNRSGGTGNQNFNSGGIGYAIRDRLSYAQTKRFSVSEGFSRNGNLQCGSANSYGSRAYKPSASLARVKTTRHFGILL